MYKRNLQTDFNIMCKKSIILLKYFQYRNIGNNSFKTSKKTRTFYFPLLFQVVLEFLARTRQEK